MSDGKHNIINLIVFTTIIVLILPYLQHAILPNRALSLQQLGRYADAANDFDEAVAEGPVSWQRLWHRAICLAELGETFRESAARDLRACLSMAKEEQIPEVLRTVSLMYNSRTARVDVGSAEFSLLPGT